MLADTLSLFRILLTVPVVYYGWNEYWRTALLFLVLAWSTDVLDGLCARNFGSLRDHLPGLDSDGIADSILAFGSAAIPVIYYIHHDGWFNPVTVALLVLYALTLVFGVLMATAMGDLDATRTKKLIKLNMPIFHGLVQVIGVSAWFAYMAYNLRGLSMTLIVALVAIAIQRRKINLWFVGRLA
ncbi:MAG: CDP-alcohol phosphatidyltransferase family protein [Microcoleus sp.]